MFTCAAIFAVAAILGGCGGGGGSAVPLSHLSAPGSSNGSASGGTINLNHVLTADYLGGYAGTHNVTAAQAAPYLSWAEASTSDSGTISGAGIKTLAYIDPSRQTTSDPLYTSDEGAFAHDCTGNRVTVPYSSSTTFYLMNAGSSNLQSDLNNWATSQQASGHFDAFFFDDTDNLYQAATMPCNVNQSSWDSANASMIAAFPYPVVFNGYALNSDAGALIGGAQVAGGVVEECYARVSQPTPPYTTGSIWATDEDRELAAAAAGRLFYCYNNGQYDGASNTALRSYVYASFLLSYNPTSSVLWDTFSTPSGLHVFPESQLVATNPLVPAPNVVDSLEAASGVYVREYGACYVAGKSVGPCAALVNPDPSLSHNYPALSRAYGHTMALSGYGVLDGGTLSTAGAAPPSTIPPSTGLVVFQ